MLSDLRALTRPFRIMLYSALALQALAGVSSLFPWLAIARLVDADPAAYPFWLGVAAGGLALWLFAQTLALHLTHLLDARLCHRLRSQLAAKLARLPLNWFVRQGESGAARALSQDIQALHQLVAHAPAELVQLAVVPGCALALLAAVQWPLLLFTLIPLLAAALLFRVIRSPRMRSAFEQRDRAFRQLNDDYRQLAAYPLLARQFPGAGIEARAAEPAGLSRRLSPLAAAYRRARRRGPITAQRRAVGRLAVARRSLAGARSHAGGAGAVRVAVAQRSATGDGDGARRRCVACGDAGRWPHSGAAGASRNTLGRALDDRFGAAGSGAAVERSRLPTGRTLVAAGRQSGRRTGGVAGNCRCVGQR